LAVPGAVRWLLTAVIAVLVTVVPVVYYRAVYTHAKRLRIVTPGILIRCGCLTQRGFIDVFERFGIRYVINLQDEFPDPELSEHYFGGSTCSESALCQRFGVRYLWLPPDIISRKKIPAERPQAIERFLAIMDDPANYPVLIHCKAGLHRTGVMAAVYRMEYEGWSPAEALREMKEHGFGEFACTSANDYIMQYILTYQPGLRRAGTQAAETTPKH
jgi:hypothetical protein